MSSLLDESVEAQLWSEGAMSRCQDSIYGRLVPGVVWTSARIEDGSQMVEGDAEVILQALRRERLPLLHEHDPGRPLGNVLEAAAFRTPDGELFIAAILGLYASKGVESFDELGLEHVLVQERRTLPEPDSTACIQVSYDPRDVSEDWVAEIVSGSPLDVTRTALSNNSSESFSELIRIALPFALLVWNPVAKTVGSEIGKAIYASVHAWLRKTIESANRRKAPLLCIEAAQQGCHVMFLIRSNNPELNNTAHEGLPDASAQAAMIIDVLARRGTPPLRLVYEMDSEHRRWAPSYAVLDQGRLITSAAMLIAMGTELPVGLSLGLTRADMGRATQRSK